MLLFYQIHRGSCLHYGVLTSVLCRFYYRSEEEKIPVGRSLKALVTNQYFWAVLLLWMFQSTNQAVVGTILPYYCKYVFHNDSWMYSTLYLSETIVLIVGILYQLDKKYPAIMKELAEREARGEL